MVIVVAGVQLTISPITPEVKRALEEQEAEVRRLETTLDEHRHETLRQALLHGAIRTI